MKAKRTWLGLALAVLAALAVGVLVAPPGGADEHKLKEIKKGEVTQQGEIDRPGEEEPVSPESVTPVGETVTIVSKTMTPPGKMAFKKFPSPNPWYFVDIETDPDAPPGSADTDTANAIKIRVEDVPETAGDWPLKGEGNLKPPGGGGGGGGPKEWHWSAKMAKIKVDLDIDGMDEEAEDDPGAVVVRNFDGNNAPRKKIILRAAEGASYGDKQVLTRASDKVKVFTAATDGTEIMFNGGDNEFEATESKDLYVEGSEASEKMGDVTLKLALKSNPDICDKVTFTVLWVTVTTDHTGSVENDNSARVSYSKMIVPQSPADYTLGRHLCASYSQDFIVEDERIARGSEFIGTVAPSDFEPQDFGGTMHLARKLVSGWIHWGPNGNENSESMGSGTDTSPDYCRDDDPQSGTSSGTIYDWDQAGQEALWSASSDTIMRVRMNFEEWAEYDDVRCSEKKEWYTRQSNKRTGDTSSGTAESGTGTTLTDSDQAWDGDEWVPGVVEIKGGTGSGQIRHVTDNTATTITVTEAWETTPDETSTYEVINTSTWAVINDVSNGLQDNESGDGTTPTEWDLDQ